MRALLVAVMLMLGACASAGPQQMQIPGDRTHPVLGDPNAPWRTRTGASPADVEAARACLARGDNCENFVQAPCLTAYDEDERSPALGRQCDWRAMAVWEDVILAILADLRVKSSGDGLRQLNDDETAWEASMLNDVGIGMDMYEGGSLAGPVGAHIRARATAHRAAYLFEIQQMMSGE
ncbi:MAG: hypothetical protein QM759_12720 [Terricaulis sp.]